MDHSHTTKNYIFISFDAVRSIPSFKGNQYDIFVT